MYFGIVDERIHALVGYGRHGKTDVIQDLRCQSCSRKISVRWGTALYRLKTSSTRVALILALMAEGADVSVLERVFGNRSNPKKKPDQAAISPPIHRDHIRVRDRSPC